MSLTMTDWGFQHWSDRLGGDQSVDRSYLCLTASTASNRMLKLENKAVVSFKLEQKKLQGWRKDVVITAQLNAVISIFTK